MERDIPVLVVATMENNYPPISYLAVFVMQKISV